MVLQYIKTPKYRLIKTSESNLYINGQPLKSTNHPDWKRCPHQYKDDDINVEERQPPINKIIGYELRDPDLIEKFNPLLDPEATWDLNHPEYYYYQQFSSLYKSKTEITPESFNPLEVKWELILEIDTDVPETLTSEFKIQKTDWSHGGLTDIRYYDSNKQLIDKILFPDILLPLRPCSFDSIQMFKIVRQYVKEHIDLKNAQITTDYNFKLVIAKLIKLAKPIEYTVDVRRNSRCRPKMEKRLRTVRLIEVFNVAPEPGRDKCEVIPSVYGDNWEDLQSKVKEYCEELVEYINTPVEECSCCNGNGVIVHEKITK